LPGFAVCRNDQRAGGAAAEPQEETLQLFGAAFGPDFHIPVDVIANPAAYTKTAGFIVTGVTETHALYTAADAGIEGFPRIAVRFWVYRHIRIPPFVLGKTSDLMLFQIPLNCRGGKAFALQQIPDGTRVCFFRDRQALLAQIAVKEIRLALPVQAVFQGGLRVVPVYAAAAKGGKETARATGAAAEAGFQPEPGKTPVVKQFQFHKTGNNSVNAGRFIAASFQFAGNSKRRLLGPRDKTQGGLFRLKAPYGKTKGPVLIGADFPAFGFSRSVKLIVKKRRQITGLKRKKRTVGKLNSLKLLAGS
jgi:hypothetical protein